MKRTRSENITQVNKRSPGCFNDTENSYKTTNIENNKTLHKPDLFQRGKAIFRRTTIPSRLIGRESEREAMMSFWTQHVLGNQPGCLYISGSPGTGKTAMLNDVKRQMLNNNNKTKHHINIVMINCMSINEPKAIYTKLVTELKPTSSKKFPINADILVQVEYLLLNTKKDTLNVVILDEIDHLVTKDQDVLYKIFEWAFLPTSRLVLIGIANALNLTDLLLPRLRAKNCEPQLLNFNPYSANDISAIIKDRLYSLSSNESTKVLPLMQPIAVELCAKKVAARKGDLRQAFDLCQQAIELAQKEHKRNQNNNVLRDNNNNNSSTMDPKVTVRHISIVSQPVTGNSGKDKLAHLSLQQQIVMATLLILKQKKSRSTMADVRHQYSSIIKENGTIPSVTNTELYTIISNIQDTGLLTIKNAKEQIKQQVLLNVEDTDIKSMIDTIPLLKNLFQ